MGNSLHLPLLFAPGYCLYHQIVPGKYLLEPRSLWRSASSCRRSQEMGFLGHRNLSSIHCPVPALHHWMSGFWNKYGGPWITVITTRFVSARDGGLQSCCLQELWVCLRYIITSIQSIRFGCLNACFGSSLAGIALHAEDNVRYMRFCTDNGAWPYAIIPFCLSPYLIWQW